MISQGMFVIHLRRQEWGVGKVLEGRPGTSLRLWFEMGGEKKISAEYHDMLRQVATPRVFHVPSVNSSPPNSVSGDRFYRDYFVGKWEFTFSRREREQFRSGYLIRQWAEQYPFLFGPEEVSAALSSSGKRTGSFFEWVSAVRLYEARGYYSLLRDYAPSSQNGKHEFVGKLCGKVVTGFMAAAPAKTQFPDLLVYTPDLSEWYFCDVKGPGDIVRKSEETFFPRLADGTGAGIYLLTLSLS